MTSLETLRQERPKPSAMPGGGPPGSRVTVRMGGLPPGIPLLVSFGALSSGYEILARTETDAEGVIDVEVTVPSWASPADRNFFFVSPPDELNRIVSDPFLVTGADGVLRISGRLAAAEGVCTSLESDDGRPVALVGDTTPATPGASVLVEGTVAEGPICGEVLTLRVRRITLR